MQGKRQSQAIENAIVVASRFAIFSRIHDLRENLDRLSVRSKLGRVWVGGSSAPRLSLEFPRRVRESVERCAENPIHVLGPIEVGNKVRPPEFITS